MYEFAINYLNEKVSSNEIPVSKFAKIQGILIDTKFLMNHYLSNSHDKYIKELAGMIETSYEENKGVHN